MNLMEKSKSQVKKNIFQKEIILILFCLLAIPVSVFGVYQMQQFFSQAASSTFKVTRNHQLTCSEQPDWGNIVTLFVKDENGNPLPNTQIEYWAAYSDQCPDKPNASEGILTTDGGGKTQFDNRWPGCLPCQPGSCSNNPPCKCSYPHDYRIHFFFKVANARSDTAVEISSGIYGDECPSAFCPGRSTVNVWGHWGYQIEFKRNLQELAEEEAPTDHAGQSDTPGNQEGTCKLWHFYTPYQDYNPHRGTSLPTSTPTPKAGLPTSTPSPTGSASSPAPTEPPAACPCEVWGKNYCDGTGYGSYDVFVQKFNTLEECQAYQTPISYTCNCDEHCTIGNDHAGCVPGGPGQCCTSGLADNIANGKSSCSCRDFRVQVINPAVCGTSPGSSCSCEKMDVSGVIAKGQTISLVTYAKNKVLNMIYHVEKNGREISNSGPIASVGPDETANRYYTAWNWLIPSSLGEVEYKIRVEINCGPKTQTVSAIAKQESNPISSLFHSFGSFLNNLFNLKEIFPAFVPSPPTPMPTGKVFAPKLAKSLQLGTFIFPTVTYFEKDCTWLKFRFK